ncbi:MAG TPA: DUF1501 domain-containing protein [Candidatus Polarisedimenticolaceae bacterium]|nr:DUF1501 domain-containing protein [Candidatus Polarisedimenticolaceae bacterium]
MSDKLNRRQFLGQASCAAVGTTALFNTVLNMGMFNALACGAPDEYRGLVCLFLGGGIDSFNVLVPAGAAEYQEYAAVRADLALPQASLLPITPATPDGRSYGLHPGIAELQALFQAGQLAFVANVGTLAAPTTLQQFRNGSVALPLGLFSHSDQALHWQTSLPDQRSAIGWAGRMADMLQPENCSQAISLNISLAGTNVYQTGAVTQHYTITENGSIGLRDYGGTAPAQVVQTEAIDGLLGLQYQHLFEKTYAARMRGAIDAHLAFSAAIAGIPPLTTQFSNTSLSRRFRMVALTIAAREALGMKRQSFFIETGGWDHHDEVLLNQEAMLPVISRALSEFHSALVELGVAGQVTTFTASDFGRTLTSNGRGSDHAWGGNHIVMGGAVTGGDIYGTFPALYIDNPLDTGRGRLIPTTSVDEYFAEMALWFGVPAADLDRVLPNIARFYTPGSGSPLGLLDRAGRPPLPRGGMREIVPRRGTARVAR